MIEVFDLEEFLLGLTHVLKQAFDSLEVSKEQGRIGVEDNDWLLLLICK